MVTLQRDVERLVKNEMETEALVARLQERNAKLERVAEAARLYLAIGSISEHHKLRIALRMLDDAG